MGPATISGGSRCGLRIVIAPRSPAFRSVSIIGTFGTEGERQRASQGLGATLPLAPEVSRATSCSDTTGGSVASGASPLEASHGQPRSCHQPYWLSASSPVLRTLQALGWCDGSQPVLSVSPANHEAVTTATGSKVNRRPRLPVRQRSTPRARVPIRGRHHPAATRSARPQIPTLRARHGAARWPARVAVPRTA